MRNNRRFADIVDGEGSPLNAAVSQRDRSILDAVAQAVRHGQTMLAYQPILQSTPPHEVAFYEGLIRIPDETGRIIPAGQFLPFVEDSDLGRQIDCSALALGLRMLKANPGLRLSINMSARSIGYKRWTRS